MIEQGIDLKPYNTFGISAKAQFFARIHSIADVTHLLETPVLAQAPKLILGEGSNLLFTQNYAGCVIKNEIKGIQILSETDETVLVKIGAGENWHQWVLYSLTQGWGGAENLSLIPGTVGAAPVQNIGAYGVEFCHIFHELTAVNLMDGSVVTFSLQDCEFGYRESIFKSRFKNQYVITDVTLKLQKKPVFNLSYRGLQDALNDTTLSLKSVSDAVIKIRQSKLPDPNIIGNAGSFFKNPLIEKNDFLNLQKKYSKMPYFTDANSEHIKISAGWLIEQCGWKGKRVGDVGVYDKQALVLVNYGEGTGSQLYEMAMQIQKTVQQKFGILLMPEVNIF